MRTAKLQPVFAAAVCAADPDERHVREMAAQINPEKHHRHGHLLAARSRGLSFCRPMVRAGQALRLLAESSVPGAVRGDGPFIRWALGEIDDKNVDSFCQRSFRSPQLRR